MGDIINIDFKKLRLDVEQEKSWEELCKRYDSFGKDTEKEDNRKVLKLDFSLEELTQRPKGIFFINKFYLTGRFWGKITSQNILEKHPNFFEGVDCNSKTHEEMFALYCLYRYFDDSSIPLKSLDEEYKRRKNIKYSDACLETSKGVFKSSIKVWKEHLGTESIEIPRISVENPFS